MKNTQRTILFIITITILAAMVDFLPLFSSSEIKIGQIKRDLNLKLGLDLAGGTHLVMEADMAGIKNEDKKQALESAKIVVERRVNMFGVSEPNIQSSQNNDNYRILVELAGVTDINQAIDLIGKTARLEFREEPASVSAYGSWTQLTGLNGKHLRQAGVAFDNQTGETSVSLEFNDEGGRLFEEITKRNLNKQVAIFLDDQLLSAPTVQTVIVGGEAQITGKFTTQEAKQLSIALNAGALPVPLKIMEQRTVGATLGDESVKKSLTAGAIGLAVVAVFMVINYRKRGLIANLALIIYTLITLAIFKLIPVTLTLAGIAGFILSIGMAVDANILIFERAKEEEKWGKPAFIALEAGFNRAWTSIRDSNISSLITCAILYNFGTGTVRGFALTLALGILVSLFSAITVTHTLLRLFYAKNEHHK